jgi:hypothetical protein
MSVISSAQGTVERKAKAVYFPDALVHTDAERWADFLKGRRVVMLSRRPMKNWKGGNPPRRSIMTIRAQQRDSLALISN